MKFSQHEHKQAASSARRRWPVLLAAFMAALFLSACSSLIPPVEVGDPLGLSGTTLTGFSLDQLDEAEVGPLQLGAPFSTLANGFSPPAPTKPSLTPGQVREVVNRILGTPGASGPVAPPSGQPPAAPPHSSLDHLKNELIKKQQALMDKLDQARKDQMQADLERREEQMRRQKEQLQAKLAALGSLLSAEDLLQHGLGQVPSYSDTIDLSELQGHLDNVNGLARNILMGSANSYTQAVRLDSFTATSSTGIVPERINLVGISYELLLFVGDNLELEVTQAVVFDGGPVEYELVAGTFQPVADPAAAGLNLVRDQVRTLLRLVQSGDTVSMVKSFSFMIEGDAALPTDSEYTFTISAGSGTIRF